MQQDQPHHRQFEQVNSIPAESPTQTFTQFEPIPFVPNIPPKSQPTSSAPHQNTPPPPQFNNPSFVYQQTQAAPSQQPISTKFTDRPELGSNVQEDPPIAKFILALNSKIESLTPFPLQRWAVSLFLFILFGLRVLLSQGWYMQTYALGIYLLHQFLAFLTPKFLPEEQSLPETSQEFKPFVRVLPEFKAWRRATTALIVSLVITLFPFLDVPVFWPILLIYWILLVFVTLKTKIDHMIKYRYVPFDLGKKKYHGLK